MRITSQNVQSLPPLLPVRAAQIIRQALDSSGIVGWQEVHTDLYVRLLTELGGDRWDHYFPTTGGVPISWRKRQFKFIDAQTHVLHGGVAGVCLPRRISVVTLEDRDTGRRFAVVNLHMVASAWSGSKGGVSLRRKLWNIGQANALAVLEDLVRLGLPVVVVGDFNSQNRRELAIGREVAGRRVTYHVSRSSIDQVITIDGEALNWHVAVEDALPLENGDHAGKRIISTLGAPLPGPLPEPPPLPEPAPAPEPPQLPEGFKFPAPEPPYRGPAAHTSGRGNKPILRAVIHSTVSPCEPGGADDICAYFRSERSAGSAQYVIDPEAERQCVWDDVVAWHAPPNPHTSGFEMCDIPGPVPDDPPLSAAFKAARRSWRWAKPNQRKMLKRTANLVAAHCLAEDIPLVWLSVSALRKAGPAHARGITSHANTSLAFGQSTHWDPGFWPRRRFMRLVRREAKRLRREAAANIARKRAVAA